MDKLPDEILLRIFKLLVDNLEYLIALGQVSKRFHRITQDPKLWYYSFQSRYPIWGSRVQYTFNSTRLIDWKGFCLHLAKQQKATQNFSFEFVQEESKRKRKLVEEEEDEDLIREVGKRDEILRKYTIKEQLDNIPFWIQDPLVVDIDRLTKTGIVATGKHRKNLVENRSEHKILFWEYPSWKLIRTFELNLTPPSLTCQIIGIQSVTIGDQSVRFFSLAVGMALLHGIEHDTEDRVDIWKAIFIYRLNQDGSTKCVAHIKVSDLFLGREIFLFSDTSWMHGNSKATPLRDWMKIVSPKEVDYDGQHSVFVLAIGPIYDRITGCIQLARFDLRGLNSKILDPSVTPVVWNNDAQQLIRKNEDIYDDPTAIITQIKLGTDVSCMIHFKYPTYLNHLICTGSYQDDELSVYDWRFGVKVGSLPWKIKENEEEEQVEQEQTEEVEEIDVRPWGLESTLVLPSVTSDESDLSQRGFRLIAVGDNRSDNSKDKLEIKVWDISYLLSVNWDPFMNSQDISIDNNNTMDLTHRFSWWPRRTKELTKLAYYMLQSERYNIEIHSSNTTLFISSLKSYTQYSIQLPYSPPTKGFKSMLLSHTFDKHDQQTIPVKYTAYNVLYTSLFLLTEDGKVTVMDIETGKVTGTVENVAASSNTTVKGIDVNVIGGKEVVVTSKEGLLRGVVQ